MDREPIRERELKAPTETETAGMPAAELERLFEQYYAMVYRVAYRITGNPTDAEDALQTVFLRLLRRERAGLANAKGYLHRAAVNAALDLMRARQQARAVALEDAAAQVTADSSVAPDRALASAEIRSWLRRAIAGLSPRAGEIFVLRFFEGMENPDIARLLGTTTATVAVTIHRARDRIQKEFRSQMGGRR